MGTFQGIKRRSTFNRYGFHKAFSMHGALALGMLLVAAGIDTAASSQPKLTLTYFDIRGRGEVPRLVMANGGLNWTDIRVSFAQWPAVKPTMPYGTMPLLGVDGRNFTQSIAIQSYLAKITGIYPSRLVDQLMTDQIVYAREDLLVAYYQATIAQGVTDADRKVKYAKLVNETIPLYLGNFEKYIARNPSNSGFVIGNQVSLADIVLMEGTQNIFRDMPQMLQPFQKLQNLRNQTAAVPNIAAYLANRPLYPF